ncbi:MAG: hypothetical protein ABR588_00665 [Sphingomicrobium sp.]
MDHDSPTRRDGWTLARQVDFISILTRTRSVSRAAAMVGMSRESAYRLRRRPAGARFAAAWDKAMLSPVRRLHPSAALPRWAGYEGHRAGHTAPRFTAPFGGPCEGEGHEGRAPRENAPQRQACQAAPACPAPRLDDAPTLRAPRPIGSRYRAASP